MILKQTTLSFNALVSTLVLVFSSPVFAEQSCIGTTITTPADDFTATEDDPEFVTHTSTGLSWARCAVGQSWNNEDGICEGLPVKLNWQDALKLSSTYELEDRTDWRVPNIKELASIVERNCVDPAASATIFPNTPSDNFWSSSPNTSANKKSESWAVSFSNGRLDSRLKSQEYYVRMVRYAE